MKAVAPAPNQAASGGVFFAHRQGSWKRGAPDRLTCRLASYGIGHARRTVVEAADTACSAGTSIQARIKTLNNKNVRDDAAAVTWH